MDLIQIIFVLIILGLAWWLFTRYILPLLPAPFGTIIVCIVVLFVILWLLNLAGLANFGNIHIGHRY